MGDTFRLIAREAVAGMLGMTVDKFYHRHRDLQAHPTNPFPGPVLGNMAGARWNPRDIEAWIKRGGEHAPRDPALCSWLDAASRAPTRGADPAPDASTAPDFDRKARLRARAADLAAAE